MTWRTESSFTAAVEADPPPSGARPPAAAVARPQCIGWDLTLPRPLNEGFWEHQAAKYARWDAQSARFFAVILVGLSLHTLKGEGWSLAWHTYGPSYINQLAWMAVLHLAPRFWARHRIPLLVLLRALLVWQSVHATNHARAQLYDLGPATSRVPHVTIVIKVVLCSFAPYFPMWVACMPLPMQLQLLVTAASAVVLFLGGCTRELVTLANTPAYLSIMDASNAAWCWLVQSGSCVMVPPHGRLQGRSAAMVLAVVTSYTSSVGAALYLAYVTQWMELRAWLLAEARAAPADTEASVAFPGGACPRPTKSQLLRMRNTPGAQLLLDGRGVLGCTSMALLHGSLVYVMCLAAVLASQVLVLQLGPRLLPASLLPLYYPLRPELEPEAGMCSAEDEPEFAGLLGRLILALGGGEHWYPHNGASRAH